MKEKDTLEEITRKLDKLENDTLPQVDLSTTEFVFKDVKFQVQVSLLSLHLFTMYLSYSIFCKAPSSTFSS